MKRLCCYVCRIGLFSLCFAMTSTFAQSELSIEVSEMIKNNDIEFETEAEIIQAANYIIEKLEAAVYRNEFRQIREKTEFDALRFSLGGATFLGTTLVTFSEYHRSKLQFQSFAEEVKTSLRQMAQTRPPNGNVSPAQTADKIRFLASLVERPLTRKTLLVKAVMLDPLFHSQQSILEHFSRLAVGGELNGASWEVLLSKLVGETDGFGFLGLQLSTAELIEIPTSNGVTAERLRPMLKNYMTAVDPTYNFLADFIKLWSWIDFLEYEQSRGKKITVFLGARELPLNQRIFEFKKTPLLKLDQFLGQFGEWLPSLLDPEQIRINGRFVNFDDYRSLKIGVGVPAINIQPIETEALMTNIKRMKSLIDVLLKFEIGTGVRELFVSNIKAVLSDLRGFSTHLGSGSADKEGIAILIRYFLYGGSIGNIRGPNGSEGEKFLANFLRTSTEDAHNFTMRRKASIMGLSKALKAYYGRLDLSQIVRLISDIKFKLNISQIQKWEAYRGWSLATQKARLRQMKQKLNSKMIPVYGVSALILGFSAYTVYDEIRKSGQTDQIGFVVNVEGVDVSVKMPMPLIEDSNALEGHITSLAVHDIRAFKNLYFILKFAESANSWTFPSLETTGGN